MIQTKQNKPVFGDLRPFWSLRGYLCQNHIKALEGPSGALARDSMAKGEGRMDLPDLFYYGYMRI